MNSARASALAAGLLVAATVVPAAARGASITLAPAAVAPGATVSLTGSGFAPRRRGAVRLGAGTPRRIGTDARGRFAMALTVAARALPGRRRLIVRVMRRRIATPVTVGRPGAALSALAVASDGRRVVLAPTRGRAGSAVRLRGSRFRPRSVVRIALAANRLGTVRVSTRGRLAFAVRVPAIAPGAHRLTLLERRRRIAFGFVVLAPPPAPPAPPAPLSPLSPPDAPAVVAAAGDIACAPSDPSFNNGEGTPARCRQGATARQLVAAAPVAVLALGDTQYEHGEPANYEHAYRPSWGAMDGVVHPAAGDHEYETPQAAGYFAYFGARAGPPDRGYYSFDVAGWHLIALNSNCMQVACGEGSAQEAWLQADLAAHPSRCTLAYWHAPRFASGQAGQAPETAAFWQDLYAAGADVVLGAHNHHYERFAPQTPATVADPQAGIREFIVGTGGASLQALTTVRPNSEVRIVDTFGVLLLTLHADGYEWRFMAESGATLDAGTTACH
jgi:acid phosphatase type 7